MLPSMLSRCPAAGPGQLACFGTATGKRQHAMPSAQSVRKPDSSSASHTQRQAALRATEGDEEPAGRDMASEFAAYVLSSGAASPAQRRKPSHLMPPTEVVAAQLDALQRNDWPEADAGVHAAFAFSKPADAETLLPGQVSAGRAAAWGGTERWLTFEEFSHQLHRPPYHVLLGCDSWQAMSPMTFPRQRAGERALQAVEVLAARRPGDSGGGSGFSGGVRPYTFTFCLERVDQGPYKGCWLTVGLRCGDYATV